MILKDVCVAYFDTFTEMRIVLLFDGITDIKQIDYSTQDGKLKYILYPDFFNIYKPENKSFEAKKFSSHDASVILNGAYISKNGSFDKNLKNKFPKIFELISNASINKDEIFEEYKKFISNSINKSIDNYNSPIIDKPIFKPHRKTKSNSDFMALFQSKLKGYTDFDSFEANYLSALTTTNDFDEFTYCLVCLICYELCVFKDENGNTIEDDSLEDIRYSIDSFLSSKSNQFSNPVSTSNIAKKKSLVTKLRSEETPYNIAIWKKYGTKDNIKNLSFEEVENLNQIRHLFKQLEKPRSSGSYYSDYLRESYNTLFELVMEKQYQSVLAEELIKFRKIYFYLYIARSLDKVAYKDFEVYYDFYNKLPSSTAEMYKKGYELLVSLSDDLDISLTENEVAFDRESYRYSENSFSSRSKRENLLKQLFFMDGYVFTHSYIINSRLEKNEQEMLWTKALDYAFEAHKYTHKNDIDEYAGAYSATRSYAIDLRNFATAIECYNKFTLNDENFTESGQRNCFEQVSIIYKLAIKYQINERTPNPNIQNYKVQLELFNSRIIQLLNINRCKSLGISVVPSNFIEVFYSPEDLENSITTESFISLWEDGFNCASEEEQEEIIELNNRMYSLLLEIQEYRSFFNHEVFIFYTIVNKRNMYFINSCESENLRHDISTLLNIYYYDFVADRSHVNDLGNEKCIVSRFNIGKFKLLLFTSGSFFENQSVEELV